MGRERRWGERGDGVREEMGRERRWGERGYGEREVMERERRWGERGDEGEEMTKKRQGDNASRSQRVLRSASLMV